MRLSIRKKNVVVGCEDVPHFDAVAKGEKVDTEKVQPGIVARAERGAGGGVDPRWPSSWSARTAALPDAVCAATGLPVYDAITARFFPWGFPGQRALRPGGLSRIGTGARTPREFGQHVKERNRSTWSPFVSGFSRARRPPIANPNRHGGVMRKGSVQHSVGLHVSPVTYIL